ncbi:protein of unknown function [Blastococcus saxobsidens DD2]|uniref:Uncharacterized protein n=1 Tax=Blastococcus saxobsidens (strain DD2) TaxID=1146883 RepID=H6RNM6_BLASD|nr:protein of unknown function [Blastococcus saxobsidens DD2]
MLRGYRVAHGLRHLSDRGRPLPTSHPTCCMAPPPPPPLESLAQITAHGYTPTREYCGQAHGHTGPQVRTVRVRPEDAHGAVGARKARPPDERHLRCG